MPFEPSPAADLAFRKPLLEHYLESQSATGLADWLRELGQDPSGSVAERIDRVRANTRYLGMAARDFPQQTENYLALPPGRYPQCSRTITGTSSQFGKRKWNSRPGR